jgi:hypothetical protein
LKSDYAGAFIDDEARIAEPKNADASGLCRLMSIVRRRSAVMRKRRSSDADRDSARNLEHRSMAISRRSRGRSDNRPPLWSFPGKDHFGVARPIPENALGRSCPQQLPHLGGECFDTVTE